MSVLQILFANGKVLSVQPYVWDGDVAHAPTPWDGSVSISGPITVGTVDQGAAGVDPWLVEFATPQAVTGPLTLTQLQGELPLPVLATIDTTGLATSAKQDIGNTSLSSIDGKLTSPLTVTGPLTDTQLRATPVPISGTVTATVPNPLPVSLASIPNPSNLDVALSTRTKPADQQHTILDSGTLTSITNALPAGTNYIGDVAPTARVFSKAFSVVGDSVSIDCKNTAAIRFITNNNLPGDTYKIEFLINGFVAVTFLANAWPTTGAVTSWPSTGYTSAIITSEGPLGGPSTLFGVSSGIEVSGGVTVSGTVTAIVDTSLLATSAKQDIGNVSLAAIDVDTSAIITNTAPLTTVQGADSADVVGPMIQGIVNDSPQSFNPNIIQPLSLTTEGRLRVSSADSYIDRIWQNTFDTPWGAIMTTVANSDLPFAGEVNYV